MPVTDTEAAPQAMRQEDVAVLLALVMAIMLLHALAVGNYKSRRCAKRVANTRRRLTTVTVESSSRSTTLVALSKTYAHATSTTVTSIC